MSQTAHVRSIDAVEQFRGAFVRFGEQSAQALDEIRMELDRFVEWLEQDQVAYWKNEVRRCEAKVAEAKVDLHRARSATIDPEHTPSCLQEQKVLDAAKRRLLSTEEKLQVVKRWVPAIRQAVQDYQTQIAPLVNYLTYEQPRGVNFLRQLVQRLEDYVAIAPPTALATTAFVTAQTGSQNAGSMTTSAQPDAEVQSP
jgi:capsule polysaccharide export protein KpsE/RkpR